MTDHEVDGPKEDEQEFEQQDPVESGGLESDPMREAQEGKGYGEDEGERDDALSG